MYLLRLAAALAAFVPLYAFADNVLHPGTPVLDRPTLISLGVQLPLTGDDNYNATVTVRYRKSGDVTWLQAQPLFRVRPDTTLPYVISPQFAGSILDLRPSTTYQIELHATDPDGAVDQTFSLTATTRSIPGDPPTPHIVNVVDADSLNTAMGSAQPGDIITLANGTYGGSFFSIFRTGTAANPIVIRGASQDGVIIDGGGCSGCNIFEFYGSYIHLERMTIQNGERAIRFSSNATVGNVVRGVHIKGVQQGIGSKPDQLDYYIADNIIEGLLTWPSTYPDDNGAQDVYDGINLQGQGHVIAHNRISGFGDAMKTSQTGARSNDFYGNDILWDYDNGVELDGTEGNARLMRNRFTNAYNPISAQPIFGGPAYIYRNVAMNTTYEQLKLHSVANPTREPNGIFIYNNTFVSAYGALILETPTSVHHFALANNLFIGPAIPANGTTVDFFAFIDDGLFNYNGYWPDGKFSFNFKTGYVQSLSFAAMRQALPAIEPQGRLVNPQTLASGIIGPADYRPLLPPQDFTPSFTSAGLDHGVVIPNISDNYSGAAPDLGALELGCAPPVYGPRPQGTDETNEPYGCTTISTVAVPQSITAFAGTPQTAILQATFALPLQARVLDSTLNPVAGIPVTFTAPSSGASGTFPGGGTTIVAGTDASGIASAVLTANSSLGGFTVTATVSNLTPAVFSLNNVLPAPPTADSVTGPAGVRINQIASFTAKYSSAGGYANITQALLLVNSSPTNANGCLVTYNKAANAFILANDAGTGNAGQLTVGSTGSIQNSRCILNGTGSSVKGLDKTLTIVLNLTFTSAFLGTQQIYLTAIDQGNQSSGTQNRGSIAISLPDLVLHPTTPTLDRPTLISLGVQMLISGDENFNAVVTMQYRKQGDTTWKQAQPLYRVHPDTTLPYVIAPQFAGSILDLRPATTYEIQIHAIDTDGAIDQTYNLTGTTRPVPGDPATPRIVNVANTNALNAALSAAQPGDIINIANGIYFGQFAIGNSGTALNPIVIRGTSLDNTVLDGQNCSGCNILEVYGSFIHIERLTLESGERGIKFQTVGAQGNVVRGTRIWNVLQGIGSRSDQLDFYIADNSVEGLLAWPSTYPDDNGAQDVYDGIHMEGFGHVVSHNRISGFGDAMKIAQNGARANDFYGNDILWNYDNGVELDGSEGNVRLMRNRFTNAYNPISAQPIYGGPAYIYRNVAMNTTYEQLKLHSVANPTREPNGVFIYNNTFVSAYGALILETPTSVHHFALENNIFIGPAAPVNNTPVDWFAFIDDGLFNYNGYWPDGQFSFNFKSGYVQSPSFAAMRQALPTIEPQGLLVNAQTLASGIIGPANYRIFLQPPDFTLSANSVALNRGTVIPNISDVYRSTAPDLGALELGCTAPTYGPRAAGVDETNEVFGCTPGAATPASIVTNAGTPQNVTVGTVAAVALKAKVLDATSQPVSGVTVTFTAPTGPGAGGTFPGSASTATAVTDASGIATAPAFTANTTAGTYTVNASVAGVAGTAGFSLTNIAVVPASIITNAGTPQNVTVGAVAAVALKAKVLDASSLPISGVTVTFTAPSSGATGTFPGSASSATAVTDASGVATAPAFTANNVTGAYTVTAAVAGVANPASFSLTNTATIPASIVTVSGTPQTVVVQTATAPLQAKVLDSLLKPIAGATVTFTAPSSGASGTFPGGAITATAVTDATGVATAPAFTVNATAGTFTVTAKVGNLTPANFVLTTGPGILVPAYVTMNAGDQTPLLITLSGPAPSGGVFVTLTSSKDTTVSLNVGSVFIREGQTTSSQPKLNGIANGSATITAAATGYISGRTLVQVGPPSGTLTFSPSTATISAPGSQNLTLNLSPPAPTSLTIALSSSNANIASVPATVNVAANATSTTIPVTALAAGSATITAISPPIYGPGTAAITVTGALAITTTSLPNGQVNVPYSQTLAATGGNKVYTWSLVTGSLGPLTLSPSTGVISGTPTATVTNSPLRFKVTDTSNPVQTATVNLTLTITNAPSAGSVTATGGTPQSANTGTQFGSPLVALVKDTNNSPMSGVLVTFAAPGSGASGTFAGGVNTATTNASGLATSVAFTANSTGGSYSVTASVAGVATPATFSLTNVSVPSLIMPGNLNMTTGDQIPFTVTLSTPPPTGSGGVFVLLFSSNSSVAALNIGSVLIKEGQTTSTQVKVTAGSFGTATITTSAAGYTTATTQVQVGAPGGTLSFQPTTATINAPGSQNLALNLSPAAPAAGVTVSLQSSNPAAATVPATVAVPGNATSVLVPVTGVAGGSATITATASPGYGPATAAITVNSALAITTTSLPNGQVGVQYSKTLTAVGGNNVYSWTLLSGSLGALTLNQATGLISGIPTAAVTNSPLQFKVTDTSAPQQFATVNLTLTIAAAAAPASVAASSGTPQSTNVSTAFSSPLVALVKNSNGVAMGGITVTFAAPGSGASGTFAGGVTTAITNSSGLATSAVFTANAIGGSYQVTASVSGVATPASFSMTNVSGPAIQLPPTTSMNVGDQLVLPVTLSIPAPVGGVFLTIASSNPAVVGVTVTNVLIPEGQTTTTRARINAVAAGSSAVTVSASGFATATTQVAVH